MKLHELKPAKGARKSRTRRGRGDASGYGSFSGRGCKGQNARSGGGVRIGFEGGQTTLLQRMPKRRGFKNPNRVVYSPVNFSALEKVFSNGDTVNLDSLKEKRLVRKNASAVKILGQGELSKKLTFQGVAFSDSAQTKAEKAGCKIEGLIETKSSSAGLENKKSKKIQKTAEVEKGETVDKKEKMETEANEKEKK